MVEIGGQVFEVVIDEVAEDDQVGLVFEADVLQLDQFLGVAESRHAQIQDLRGADR